MRIRKIALATAVIAGIASGSIATLPAMAVETLAKEASVIEKSNENKALISASIKLYAKDSTSSDPVISVSRNSLVFTEHEESNKLTLVNYNGIEGWVETRFVKDYVYDADLENSLKAGPRTITSSVGLTETPDPESSRVNSVTRDTKVDFTGNLYGKYSEVIYDGAKGWLETRFIKEYEGAEEETPVTPPAEETKPPVAEPEPTPEPGEELVPRNVQITASVGIRKEPVATSDRVASITRLSYAKATGKEEAKYSEIIYDGAKGWVETRFVKDYDGELPEENEDDSAENLDDARRLITASIRIYEEPDSTEAIKSITRNNIVTVTGATSGKFTEVSYEGVIGWLETRFVKPYDAQYDTKDQSYYDAVNKNDKIALGLADVKDNVGYIHSTANTKSLIKKELQKYTTIEVTSVTKGWAKVKSDNDEGFMKVSALGDYEKDNYDKWRTSTGVKGIAYVKPDSKNSRWIVDQGQVFELTGEVSSMGWKGIRWVRESTGTVYTGWIDDTFGYRDYAPKTDAFVVSSKTEKIWKESLPSVCQDVTILKYNVKPSTSSSASYLFSTKVDSSGGNWFEITVNGNMDPLGKTAQAIMKHECGHVLMNQYDQEHGRTQWIKFLNRGWVEGTYNRVEYLADAIADELGADRKSTHVGYTQNFTAAQRQLAKELVDAYAPDARNK